MYENMSEYYADLYTKLSSKYEKGKNNYLNIMRNMFTNMLRIYDKADESAKLIFNQHELFNIIFYNGICGISKYDGKLVLTAGDYVGVADPWEEFPPRYIGVRPNYQIETEVNAKNFCIAYVNPDRVPDISFLWFAEQLNEVDKSLYNNLIFSRIAPIAVIGRENEQEAYKECVNKMIDGEIINTIKSALNSLDGVNTDIIKMIDITDGKYSEKIQYLSRYHEDLIRRQAMLYGHSMATTSKSANLLTDEVHSTETFSKIYPFIMLDCVNEWLTEFNEKFNTNYGVKFGKGWEHLNEQPEEQAEQTDEETADEQAESTEQDTETENTESEATENE